MNTEDFVVFANRDTGRVSIRTSVSPISLQARAARRKELKTVLGQVVAAHTDFLLVHDVGMTLTWWVGEHDRYRTHLASDLDNVLKPLLDAVTGPNGILIDDNQIQSIHANWETPGRWGEGFQLDFSPLMQGDVVGRDGTAFVMFHTDLCYILPGEAKAHWPLFVRQYRRYDQSEDKGSKDWMSTHGPLARPWPSQRLRSMGFEVLPHGDFGE